MKSTLLKLDVATRVTMGMTDKNNLF